MENGNNDIEDDIFDTHIDEIDERETPRFELSDAEPEEEEEEEAVLNHVPSSNKMKQGTDKNQETVQNGHTWDDDFETDSVKDYGGAYREQEAKYMVTTNEAIYNRVSEELIRQRIPFEEDDHDSVKNFGGNTEGISRFPSDDNIDCLSPCIEEEECATSEELKDVILNTNDVAPTEPRKFNVEDVITRAKRKADLATISHHWQGEDTLDLTRNYAAESSLEHSRRPSSEDLSLTPPFVDTDKESTCKDFDDQQLENSEPTSDRTRLRPNNQAIKSIPSVTSANERHSGPGPAPVNANVPLGPTNRLNEDFRGTPYIARTSSAPAEPSAGGGIPLISTPQIGSVRPDRRCTTTGSTGIRSQIRGPVAPEVSREFCHPQPRPFPEILHNPSMPNSYTMSNQPFMGNISYTSRVQNPPPAYPPSVADLGNQIVRPRVEKNYYTMPGNSRQCSSNQLGVNPNVISNRPPRILPDPSYPQIPRTMSSSSPASHAMVRHPTVGRYEVPLYNQSGNWHNQVKPSKPHGNPVQPNIQSNSGGYIPQVRIVQYDLLNFSPSSQRKMLLEKENRLYPDMPEDSSASDTDASAVISMRSESHSSLNVYCHTPHGDGLETASVMSFASGASTHQDLDSKIDQVRNLLAVIDTRDTKEMAQTLFGLSSSKETCQAMRQSGCLALLVQLQHGEKSKDVRISYQVRIQSAQAMRNIITACSDNKRGRREVRVLKLLEIVRSYCVEVRYLRKESNKIRAAEQALAAIMKLSFEEEHRAALEELGAVEAIGEFLQLDRAKKASSSEDSSKPPGASICQYACMTLTNMTFGNTRNKALLGNSPATVKALLANLAMLGDEDLIQVSASVLRNLSCKADERSKVVFQDCNAVGALMTSAQKIRGESALRTILFAVWNLSAHCPKNKMQVCETPGALAFLVKMLTYRSMSNSLSVVESSGGILRNLSSHVAVKPDYRAILREHDCFGVLLKQLRSSSLRIVSNACGILWNLSARSPVDQELLWNLGAVSLLESLTTSKNKLIAKGAGAAVKNLRNFKSSQARDFSSDTRKRNGMVHGGGSPSQSRARDNHAGGLSSRSRDAHSLNSFTGSADDMTKESSRKTSRLKDKSSSGHQNGDMNSTIVRTKGVRWVDEKASDKSSGTVRKTSVSEKHRSDGSPDEQMLLLNSRGELYTGKKNDARDVISAIEHMSLGDKNRSNRKSERAYSPKIKKKPVSKNKKNLSELDNYETDHLLSSNDSLLGRSINGSGGVQGPTSLRRKTYSDAQQSDGVQKISSNFVGKQNSASVKGVGEGRREYGGRGDTLRIQEEDTEVPRSETSDEDLKSPAVAIKSNVKNARVKALDESSEEKVLGVSVKAVDLSAQRCQCPEESDVWVLKKTKRCERCQRRRVSHSSESTSGSRRSSYESLPSSGRQPSRKEPVVNGPGCVTTI